MSLTGPVFLDGVIALTVAAFVAVVVLWPRLTRRTPWHVAGRATALLIVNVMVLLTAATQLNATYLFFASWADLHGALTGHQAQTSLDRGGVASRTPDLAAAGQAAPVAPDPQPPPNPTAGPDGLTPYVVHGSASGLTGTVLVQLPPGYSSSSAGTRYPVLEALHGYPSEPLNWIQVFDLPRVIDQEAGAQHLRAPLLVMPEVEIPRGVDTEGVNGPAGQPQVETWLTQDVPAWLGQHFRVIADRDAWATIGYSAGGFDAAMAAVLHPAQYGAGIVLGGYFRPEFGPFYDPFRADSPLGRRYDLVRAVADRPPPVALWLETSHADHLSYRSSAQFLRAVRAPTAVHAVILQNAGHRDSVWIGLLPAALRWLGQDVRGFSPGAASPPPAAPRR
ncbi:alpha/beta hydrolase [Pimelobacter simplex]|uniref:alpha/beta hydrolase n=1 Tax=Nocardioides simplex TaxID=2045 RepID=UPI0021504890|nr:esterase family protein [Pimelobacter simplex]UUW89380.1 esterase family protein [Pimelobacter simplex]UUW93208.1 esterase family protein [Pimelobacter simplex]